MILRRTARLGFIIMAFLGLTAASGGEHAISAAPSLVPMVPIDVSIGDDGRVIGSLKTTLVLDAGSEEGAAALEAAAPLLRSAAYGALVSFANRAVTPNQPVDGAALATALTTALRQADSRVARVLIVELSARPA